MATTQRIKKIKHHLSNPWMENPNHLQVIPESQKGQEKAEAKVTDHYLATQRKPLEKVEPIWIMRWLLRRYFKWRGFACRSHCGECDGKCYASIEYRGTFESKADAYWAANFPDGSGEVKPIPFNAALPEETVGYGSRDVPHCEEPGFYRKGVALPFVAIPRRYIDQLRSLEERQIELQNCLKGQHKV